MSKVKSIKLRKDPSESVYHVEEVTESTDHPPGTALDKETVDRLCEDEDWKVKIIRFK